jgi:hypothetical protein
MDAEGAILKHHGGTATTHLSLVEEGGLVVDAFKVLSKQRHRFAFSISARRAGATIKT